MTSALAILCVALSVAVIVLTRRLASLRRRKHRRRRLECSDDWTLPSVRIDAFSEHFDADAWGPGRAAEVAFISSMNHEILGGVSDLESWTLSVFARHSKCIFEFGTCSGRTTYFLARNSPPGARVGTLTLAPDQVASYQGATGDSDLAADHAIRESVFEKFFYSDTEVESKITQLFGDSKAFDETPWIGQCDLVFVDGSHARSYVVSDSKKALRMLSPGGVLLWHDYRGPHFDDTRDVYDALEALAVFLPLRHIEDTSLVAYRGEPANQAQLARALNEWH